MHRLIAALTLVILVVSPLYAVVTESESPQQIERLLHGHWNGQGPCDGNLSLNPDGTWTWKHIGPAGIYGSGTWKLTWDALPPTLTLNCTESDAEDNVGTKWVYRVMELNQSQLTLRKPDQKYKFRFQRVVE